jgi:hypothetical protein
VLGARRAKRVPHTTEMGEDSAQRCMESRPDSGGRGA